MASKDFGGVVGSLLSGLDGLISAKTVVGEPTTIDDTIILPLVDVTFAVGAGAAGKEKEDSGAGGMAGKMSPSAVLVIKKGQTKLVNIRNQDTVTKILDMIPDIIDRFSESKDDMPPDDDVVDVAFPEDKNAGDEAVDVSEGLHK